jgi:hypothetical protein
MPILATVGAPRGPNRWNFPWSSLLTAPLAETKFVPSSREARSIRCGLLRFRRLDGTRRFDIEPALGEEFLDVPITQRNTLAGASKRGGDWPTIL